LTALLALGGAVGALMGAVGVGGVLLIPAVIWLGDQTAHAAAATVLFSLVFTGIYGALLHRRAGALDWSRAIPVCVFATLLTVPGVWVAYQISSDALTRLVAALIVLVGVNVLWARHRMAQTRPKRPAPREIVGLSAVGAASGFGSGLSGAGGPLFSVPLMMLLGYPPVLAVGVSQALQVVASTTGTLAHFGLGTIDFGLAITMTAAEVVGVHFGVRFAHTTDAARLRTLAGVVCVLVGALTFFTVR